MLTIAVPDERVWFRASTPLMGTMAEIVVDGDADLVRAAFARLRHLEAAWTRFDPDSELNALHRNAGSWTDVSPDLLAALKWCVRLHTETAGIFDPTIRRALEEHGYTRTFTEVTDDESALPAPSPAPGLDGLELDTENRRVLLAPGVAIDLGGIGKGLAADMVCRELLAAGARSVYASLGGDIHADGDAPDDDGWLVPLLHPVTNDLFATHRLLRGGLVMSTTAIRRWRRGGRVVHHIIDPRTGRSAQTDVVAVAVATRSAARAEALAKSAIILGSHDGADLLRGANVRAWMLTDDGVAVIEVDEDVPCWL